jgi:hypothetical protein
MDLCYGAIGIYVLGVITGAALCGWSPAFLEKWD